MRLLDLPLEILSLIWESLGPSEMRTNLNYLLICKRLYHAGRQVFLSDLDLSMIRLSAYDAERLPPRGSQLLELFRKKTIHIAICLAQKFPEQVSNNPFIEGPGSPHSPDETPEESKISQSTVIYRSQRRRINKRLHILFDRLTRSLCLSSFILEVVADDERLGYPMRFPTIAKMLRSLPPGLRSLHLDLCYTNAVLYDRDHIHICPILGDRLADFETVRLRMRCICPEVIRRGALRGQLRKLIIRLYQPQESDYTSTGYDAQPCSVYDFRSDPINLLKHMVLEGLAKGTDLAEDMFRISFRDPRGTGINVGLIDCISNQLLFEPSEIFCYEEESLEWDYWEEHEFLLPGTNFDWQRRRRFSMGLLGGA